MSRKNRRQPASPSPSPELQRAETQLAEQQNSQSIPHLAPRVDPALTVSLYLTWGWLMATLGGVMLLLGSNVLPGGVRLSVSRAVFNGVSASTLTGYTGSLAIGDLEPFGQIVLLALTALGTACTLSLGGLAAKRVARLGVSDWTVVATALGLLVGAAAVGGAMSGWTGGLLSGVVATTAALGNSGLHLFLPEETSPILHGVLLPFSWVGGVGVVVVIDVARRLLGRSAQLTDFSRLTLGGSAGVVLVLTGAYFVLHADERSLASLALAFSLAGTTTGFGLPVEFASSWPRAMQILATLSAGLGIGLGGSSAGVGVVTLLAIVRGIGRGIRGGRNARAAYVAGAFVLVWCAWVVFIWLLLLSTETQLSGDRLLMLATGSAANVSISPDAVSIVGGGLFTLSLSMLVGRVLPLAALWGMAMANEADDRRK